MEQHSKPIAAKTEQVITNGYEECAFAENYWLVPDIQGARRIDRKADSLIRYTTRLVALGVLPEKPRVVDIGAGPGMVVNQFRQASFPCEGCEFSASGRKIAKAEFDIDILYGDLRETLPYPDGSFDFAMCVGVLTMIPKDHLEHALREIRRVLVVGGIAHLHLINPEPGTHEPHITNLPLSDWWSAAYHADLVDMTSVWPPQREGIGIYDEFSGIFMAF